LDICLQETTKYYKTKTDTGTHKLVIEREQQQKPPCVTGE